MAGGLISIELFEQNFNQELNIIKPKTVINGFQLKLIDIVTFSKNRNYSLNYIFC